jgi:hypothetical protein
LSFSLQPLPAIPNSSEAIRSNPNIKIFLKL